MKHPKPIGVVPYTLWLQKLDGDPSIADLLARYVAVDDAIASWRRAGLEPPKVWLTELGVRQRR